MLGIPEQALVLVEVVLESVLAHGSLIDKGRALLLAARCQMALAGDAAQEHRRTGTIESCLSPISLYSCHDSCLCNVFSFLQLWNLPCTLWMRQLCISLSLTVKSVWETYTTSRHACITLSATSLNATNVPCSSACWIRSCRRRGWLWSIVFRKPQLLVLMNDTKHCFLYHVHTGNKCYFVCKNYFPTILLYMQG